MAWAQKGSGRVNVRGYTRKDGTYVRPHTRSRPSNGGSSGGYTLPSSPSPYSSGASVPSLSSSSLALSPSTPSKYVSGSEVQYLRQDLISVQGKEFRMVGIAFPTEGKPHYGQFKTRLLQLLSSTLVGMQQVGVDSSGKALVRIFVNGDDIGVVLLEEGLYEPQLEKLTSPQTRAKYPWAFGGFSMAPVPLVAFPVLSDSEIHEFMANDVFTLSKPVDLTRRQDADPESSVSQQNEDNELMPVNGVMPANALVSFQLKVVVLDDLVPKPVPFTDFAIRRIEAGVVAPTLQVRTNAAGELNASLPVGTYIVESQRDTKFQGRLLRWKKEFTLSKSSPLLLTLTDADATETALKAVVVTQTKAVVKTQAISHPTTITAPVAKTSSARIASVSPSAFDSSSAKAQVMARYNSWKQAWISRNPEQLTSFYSPSAQIYSSDGERLTKNVLKTKVRELWGKDPYLRLDDLSSPLIRFYGEKAVLTVTQKYHSPNSVTQGQKKLSWTKTGNQWMVVEDEQVGTQRWIQVLAADVSSPSTTPKRSTPKTKAPDNSFPGEKFAATRYRLIQESEAYGWSNEQLRYAINEMFARYGLAFTSPEVRTQFSRFAWYHPHDGETAESILSRFNSYEKSNINLLARIRRERMNTITIE